jgi:hypothetical protein
MPITATNGRSSLLEDNLLSSQHALITASANMATHRDQMELEIVPQAKAAAIGIQRFARGAQARGSYAALRGAAVAIQARWRGVKLRRSFLRDRARIVAVQAVVRRHLARSRFLALRSAAVSLQAKRNPIQ